MENTENNHRKRSVNDTRKDDDRKSGAIHTLLKQQDMVLGTTHQWVRKKFYCPTCKIKLRTELWDNHECFSFRTILYDNSMPKYCPNCGSFLTVEENMM